MVMSTVYISSGGDPYAKLTEYEKLVYSLIGFTPPSGWESLPRRVLAYGGAYATPYMCDAPYSNLVEKQVLADARYGAFKPFYDDEGFTVRHATTLGNTDDHYSVSWEIPRAAADIWIIRFLAGTGTLLGSLAADLIQTRNLKSVQMVGSTLSVYEDTTLKISVTDANIASGYWGVSRYKTNDANHESDFLGGKLPTLSSVPRPLAYAEVPVREVLRGGLKFYEPDLPSVGVSDPVHGSYLAALCTFKAIFPAVPGATCLVALDEPVRPGYTFAQVLEALRARADVRVLTREEALRRAKQIDDKLTDVDLTRVPPTDLNFKTILGDYVRHRETLGVKRDLIDDKLMERYLAEEKGW
ncbi:MAG: hypothetical protein QXR81_08945 [Candidatus Nezhaarchaeales archaeon]